MPKMMTPAMEKFEQKNRTKKSKKVATPAMEAWKRLLKNKLAIAGLIIVILFILMSIFAPLVAPHGFDEQNYSAILSSPSAKYPMGTDNMGRDILSRIIYGARVSIPIGFICSAFSLIVGCGLGMVAAFFGGKTENIIMRALDILQAIPPMLFAIAILAAMGNGMFNLILAISLSTLPMFARVARGAIYTVKEADFIDASEAIGAGHLRQMLVHMLPNAMGPIIVTVTFSVAANILVVSSLSYLGLGVVPPTAEWGSILASAKMYMTVAPWFILFPGLMIMLAVFALNLFGDGLRDALDPRLK